MPPEEGRGYVSASIGALLISRRCVLSGAEPGSGLPEAAGAMSGRPAANRHGAPAGLGRDGEQGGGGGRTGGR